MAEAGEVVVTAEAVVEVVEVPHLHQTLIPIVQTQINLDIRGPNTRIFPQESGQDALCIINSGKMLIFVRNQLHVPGRMFSRHALRTNEPGASPSTSLITLTHQK